MALYYYGEKDKLKKTYSHTPKYFFGFVLDFWLMQIFEGFKRLI